MNALYPAAPLAGPCASNEAAKAWRTKQWNDDVDDQLGIERMHCATDPAQWVYVHSADPAMDLAMLYKQAALFGDDEAALGRIIKTIFENRLRVVAEFKVREQA